MERLGLPPITISLRDSRSIQIHALPLGWGSRTQQGMQQEPPLCLLETQLPAMWCLLSWQLQAHSWATQMMGAALLWATRDCRCQWLTQFPEGVPERR